MSTQSGTGELPSSIRRENERIIIAELAESFYPGQILELYSDNGSENDAEENEDVLLQRLDETTTNNKKEDKIEDLTLGYKYFDFHRHLQLQTEIQRRERLELLACGIPTTGLPFYTPEVLRKELTANFGRLDFSSEEGQRIFDTFSEGRWAEIHSWMEHEEKLAKDLPALQSYVKLHPVSEILYILKKKSYSDRIFLCDQDPDTNAHNLERFILPRCIPKEVQKILIGKSLPTADEEENMLSETTVLAQEYDNKLPPILREKPMKLMDKHSLGIQPVQFATEWYQDNHYYIETSQFGMGTLSELMHTVSDIFCMRSILGTVDLAFPAYLNGHMCSVDTIYKRIWQRLIFLLHYHGGKLPAEENLNELVRQFFQIEFHVCLDRMEFFVQEFLWKHFPRADLLHLDKTDPLHPYLQFKRLKDAMVQQSARTKNTAQGKTAVVVTVPNIPPGYARLEDEVEWISNYIRPDSHGICYLGQILPHNCFFVNSIAYWTVMDEFMKKLLFEYQNKDKLREATPHPACLVPGLLVAVCHFEQHRPDRKIEYFRAKIIKVPEQESGIIYLVHFIDYGDLVRVELGHMLYLPKKFVTQMPAQGIECEFHLSGVYKLFFQKTAWDDEQRKEFVKKVLDQKINIHFVQESSQRPISGSGKKWRVSLNMVDQNKLAQITTFHIERQFLSKNGEEEEYYEDMPISISELPSDDAVGYEQKFNQ